MSHFWESERLSCPAARDLLFQMQGMIAEHELAKILERSCRGRMNTRNGSVSVLARPIRRWASVDRGRGRSTSVRCPRRWRWTTVEDRLGRRTQNLLEWANSALRLDSTHFVLGEE
jgi:hypothetical protein